MSKFETKKKLLVAESEVYRQLLKLEFQTFKVYGVRTKRRLTSAGACMRFLLSSLPILSGLFRRKGGSSLKRMGSMVILGWKAYQRFAPLFTRRRFSEANTEPAKTAAEEYLSKRL